MHPMRPHVHKPRWSRDGQTKGGISWRVGGLYTIARALNVKLFVRISAENNNTANNCKWCENRQKSPEISYNQQKFSFCVHSMWLLGITKTMAYLGQRRKLMQKFLDYTYTVSRQHDMQLLVTTLAKEDRFSIFFHWQLTDPELTKI